MDIANILANNSSTAFFLHVTKPRTAGPRSTFTFDKTLRVLKLYLGKFVLIFPGIRAG